MTQEEAKAAIRAVMPEAEFMPIGFGRGLALLVPRKIKEPYRCPECGAVHGDEDEPADDEFRPAVNLFAPSWAGYDASGKPTGEIGGPVVADIEALLALFAEQPLWPDYRRQILEAVLSGEEPAWPARHGYPNELSDDERRALLERLRASLKEQTA